MMTDDNRPRTLSQSSRIVSMFSKKLRGSSLVEMIIAILMLSVVLMGMMAGIMIARGSVHDKEHENAREVALKVLETIEAVSYDQIPKRVVELDGAYFDGFRIHVSLPRSGDILEKPNSRIVEVSVELGSGSGLTNRVISMRREVSPSAYKNTGDRN